MKDYITQPDRIVNVKRALESTVTPLNGGLRIGAAVKMVDLAEHAEVARMYPAIAAAAIEVGTPQIRNQGDRRRQPEPATALLVLPQRRVRLPQERREHLLLDQRREPVSRHPRWRPELHRAPVEPGGADGRLRRDIPSRQSERRTPGARGRVLHAAGEERVDRERAGAQRAVDARDPAGARQSEERALRSALQGVARLADRVRDRPAGDGRYDGTIGARRDGRGGANPVALDSRPSRRSPARRSPRRQRRPRPTPPCGMRSRSARTRTRCRSRRPPSRAPSCAPPASRPCNVAG